MKRLGIIGVLLLCASLAMAADAKLANVRIGIHANEGGTSLAAVAQQQGFFKKYGINPVFTIVESGPIEMTAMRADNRTLDIGYIGAGVAWNPIDGAGNQLSFVFLDCLSNSEMLVAKKGLFADANKNGSYDNAEIYAGLKGQTVYIEVGTTPGAWFLSLVSLANTGKADADKLWISCETSSYLVGYAAPNANPANKVTVVNTLNSNLPAGMATDSMSIVAGFSPATNTMLKTNKKVEAVATTAKNFPPEKSFPNTWVASNKWLDENPAVAQNFINALYEASAWRASNLETAMTEAEQLCQRPTGSFDEMNLVAPTNADLKAWFASPSSRGYLYMKALYDAKVPNVPKGNPVKDFAKAFSDKYLLQAIRSVK